MKGKYIRTRKIKEKCRESKLGDKNPMFGRNHTEEAKEKVRISKLMEKNPNWKGDDIKNIDALHTWLKRNNPKPLLCEECNCLKDLDLANISGNYTRDIKDYKWLCRKCHRIFDCGRKKANV